MSIEGKETLFTATKKREFIFACFRLEKQKLLFSPFFVPAFKKVIAKDSLSVRGIFDFFSSFRISFL